MFPGGSANEEGGLELPCVYFEYSDGTPITQENWTNYIEGQPFIVSYQDEIYNMITAQYSSIGLMDDFGCDPTPTPLTSITVGAVVGSHPKSSIKPIEEY
jgi:hypothetical protein